MNAAVARYKTSKVMNITGYQILIVFSIQIIIAMIGSSIGTTWMINNLHISYLSFEDNGWDQNWGLLFLQTTGTWVLIFTNFVPISLLVTLEIVKLFQGIFMSWDVLMFDREQGEPMKAQCTSINEDLGQIEYIFSDKTGTLTCNVMEFKKFSCKEGRFSLDDDTHSNQFNSGLINGPPKSK